jgi:1,2-phenylacetyl-CoA epoxidase PaaB subunit
LETPDPDAEVALHIFRQHFVGRPELCDVVGVEFTDLTISMG